MSYDYVLDSFAWAEFFDGTVKGQKVRDLLELNRIAASVIVLAELSDKCAREGRDVEPFIRFIQAHAVIIPVTLEIAVRAGKRKKELRKSCSNISLADALHYETAKLFGAAFVTGDSDFKNIGGVLFL